MLCKTWGISARTAETVWINILAISTPWQIPWNRSTTSRRSKVQQFTRMLLEMSHLYNTNKRDGRVSCSSDYCFPWHTHTHQIISTWLSSITLHLRTFVQSHICVYLHAVPSVFSHRRAICFVPHVCMMIVIQRLRVERSSTFILYSILSQSRVTSKWCVKPGENVKNSSIKNRAETSTERKTLGWRQILISAVGGVRGEKDQTGTRNVPAEQRYSSVSAGSEGNALKLSDTGFLITEPNFVLLATSQPSGEVGTCQKKTMEDGKEFKVELR